MSQDFYIFEKKRQMDNGICLNPMIPVRSSASRQGEMSDQLLFGEAFHILEKHGEWLYISRIPDRYEGWIQSTQVISLSREETEEMKRQAARIASRPFTQLQREGETIWIP